jgi:hypothetical protein
MARFCSRHGKVVAATAPPTLGRDDELRGHRSGVGVGNDLVVIAVHHQDRHRDLAEEPSKPV